MKSHRWKIKSYVNGKTVIGNLIFFFNLNSNFNQFNFFSDFSTLENLALHVTQAHAITGPGGLYYCQWENCPRSERGFNARYKMLVHVRTHTKEKPHLCNVEGCNKSFSRAENLKIHTRSHSGEKPYKCPIEGCIKAYSNSSDRFKHTRTHSTDKPYFCKIQGCQKRYTDPSSLRKHIKTFKHENLPIEQIEVIEEPISSQNDFYPKIEITKKCTCSHDCLEHVKKTEILKYEAMFNLQKSEKTLWLNDGVKVEQMEWIDLPLDLSIHRSGY